jgi:hypothetical protein
VVVAPSHRSVSVGECGHGEQRADGDERLFPETTDNLAKAGFVVEITVQK